jgi:2-phospho-L-lactate/phosphoenolpyruvate guanylyltransferase
MVCFAILPVKTFGAAKQRLSPALPAAPRRALAEAMLADVLSALARVPELHSIVVVTADPAARQGALSAGADVVADAEEAGQSPAAAAGIRHALAAGATRVLLVPGDTPLLDPADVSALLARTPSPGVAIVPDRHGPGTNALVLDPPELMAPSFGPGSFERHAAAARAAGTEPRVEHPPGLLLDVDTGDDLATVAEALALRPGAAPRTRAALAEPAASAGVSA